MKNRPMIARALGFSLILIPGALLSLAAVAERVSDIASTSHNFSVGSGGAEAVDNDELCVFCHTPHGANQSAPAPLWNRTLSGETYQPYTSSSIDALGLDQPGGSSKVCLSCHDGTIAIGAVNVFGGEQKDPGSSADDIAMTGVEGDGTIPVGVSGGASSGFTRKLGSDLRNDHPISFTYDTALATADGELKDPAVETHIADRVAGFNPLIPLENGQLQCSSCHDPHITDTVETNIKFLRLHRFQQQDPVEGAFDKDNDIICLACHDKSGWAKSAHANSAVANETYTAAAAGLREFADGMPVWKGACLNCHDTHTVEGARRLLREGTNSGTTPKQGGASAIEETCFQCHSDTNATLVSQGSAGFEVPDIQTDFDSTRHMPLADTVEVHDIGTGGLPQGGKDFVESRSLLGTGGDSNRHVECTDCHNPHRVIKNRVFNAAAAIPDAAGTHEHSTSVRHNNLASGVLKGAFGVEPQYGSTAFMAVATGYDVKRGNPAEGASTAVSSSWVTREYQICFKCHSTYGYVTPPNLTGTGGRTPSGINGVTQYTDQAMEFQAPAADKGEPGGNHRSWHPVMEPTGRTTSIRGADNNSWLSPWNVDANIGYQTMLCSDCHGSDTSSGTVVPDGGENGESWGPHGSANNFILKGQWDTGTGGSNSNGDLCFKCHSYNRYSTRNSSDTGFSTSGGDNLHGDHADKLGPLECTWCHVAVPHGWKNKALLVNLNDVGPEGGLPAGTQVRNRTTAQYNNPPYYLDAVLKVKTWASSGNWSENSCGSSGSPGNGETGRDWMRDSNENCDY